MEALKHPILNAHFATINETHHIALRNLEELLNINTKGSYQQSNNRHNGRQCEAEKEPEQGSPHITHIYPTRQQQQQTPNTRVQTQTRKPGIPPRVAQSEVTIETQ